MGWDGNYWDSSNLCPNKVLSASILIIIIACKFVLNCLFFKDKNALKKPQSIQVVIRELEIPMTANYVLISE